MSLKKWSKLFFDGSRHGTGLHLSVYAFTNEDVDTR